MTDEKDIRIVIRAEDEFSSVMEKAASSAESASLRIKGAFGSASTQESAGSLNEYSTGLKKVMELEAARSEEQKRARALSTLDRLEQGSPYKPDGKGAERIYLDYQRRLEALQAYNTAVINESVKAGISQQRIDAEYTDLSLSYAAKRRDFQIGAAAETAGAVANSLQNLFVATDSKHRAIFETMKAFAIAQTVIDTYKGATAAYAALAGIPVIGPALGTAAAAAAIAAGLARVAQIRGTHPGGGSISADGSALTASSTAAGDYSVDYLFNMLETNIWKAADGHPAHISYDAGTGTLRTADYIAVAGHNLYSTGALLGLEYSTDGISYSQAFAPFVPSTDGVVLKEFSNPGAFRYWRVTLSGMSAAPFMAVCVWGISTELDYATASFDPHAQEAAAAVSLSQGGYVAGVHTQYIERTMSLKFDYADAALYAKIKDWWETSGVRNFFVAWECVNNPGDVFLMRPDARFNNPLKYSSALREVSITLRGRKE